VYSAIPGTLWCNVGLAGATRCGLIFAHDASTGAGKTTAHTDTYHGRFIELVPDEKVVEVVEFETADPALQGEMTLTISLADAVFTREARGPRGDYVVNLSGRPGSAARREPS
jgi:hypothetical protein